MRGRGDAVRFDWRGVDRLGVWAGELPREDPKSSCSPFRSGLGAVGANCMDRDELPGG